MKIKRVVQNVKENCLFMIINAMRTVLLELIQMKLIKNAKNVRGRIVKNVILKETVLSVQRIII